MALEEFLKQVKETWQTYELEMVNYQNKCRLIRGWDDLFNKVLLSSQYYLHAGLITYMKNSTIVYMVKMESVSEIIIFGLKKILAQNYKFSNKQKLLPRRGIKKIILD